MPISKKCRLTRKTESYLLVIFCGAGMLFSSFETRKDKYILEKKGA